MKTITPACDIPNPSSSLNIPPIVPVELFCSPIDPPSFLLDEETAQKLSPNISNSLSRLKNQDTAKLSSSPAILNFIDTSIQRLLQTETNERQDQQNISNSDRVLRCGHIVKDIPNLYVIIVKSRLVDLNRSNDLFISMDKIMKWKQFDFRNKNARHLVTITMAYVPIISNSSAALFIPCILASYFTEIGYSFDPVKIGSISPPRNTLLNINEE